MDISWLLLALSCFLLYSLAKILVSENTAFWPTFTGFVPTIRLPSSGIGAIQILRQYLFGLYLTHPPYVSINSTESQQKMLFSDPTHPPSSFADVLSGWSHTPAGHFCWHIRWIVINQTSQTRHWVVLLKSFFPSQVLEEFLQWNWFLFCPNPIWLNHSNRLVKKS